MADISKLIPPKRSKDDAYKMGVDCALNSANTQNCHFSIFSSRENTKAWEDGKKFGEALKKKGRVNFDDWYAENVSLIDQMSIAEVRKRREELKATLENLQALMREDGIKESRRKYLMGRRKFLVNLLSYTKERIKLFNVVAHNGVSQNVALRFVQIAAEKLPQGTFQKIYGLAVMESEERESSIEAVRDFVNQFKRQFTQKGM